MQLKNTIKEQIKILTVEKLKAAALKVQEETAAAEAQAKAARSRARKAHRALVAAALAAVDSHTAYLIVPSRARACLSTCLAHEHLRIVTRCRFDSWPTLQHICCLSQRRQISEIRERRLQVVKVFGQRSQGPCGTSSAFS